MSVLQVSDLSWVRDRVNVLDRVSFSVEARSIVGVTGPNGAGKTSLFELLMGWHRPKSGSIEWSDSASRSILPQIPVRPQTLPLSVSEFIEMGTWSKDKTHQPALELSEALKVLELSNLKSSLIGEISGGEWKRVCLARTLVQRANVYLLDEPFNYLDFASEERVGHLLQSLAREKSKTFLVITHDWHAINHFFDRVIFLNKKVLADGSPSEVGARAANWLDPRNHEWMHSS